MAAPPMVRALLLSLAVFLSMLAAPARAEVLVTFWSHAQDSNYPHAFLVMRGTVESTGRRVDDNIGFTARNVSPAILIRSVEGRMDRVSRSYMARATSRAHFTLRLDDAQYARLQAFIARWRAQAQPSYNLNDRNCVHFVMEAAALLGLSVNRRSSHILDPPEFLDEVMQLNPQLAATRR